MSLIIIDPGHGGADPGAIANGLQEKDLNLRIALALKALLESASLSVLLTRETDEFLSLEKRCKIANNANAQLFLSIHCNAGLNPSAHGLEVFHYPGSKLGQKLAQALFQELSQLGRKMRGVRAEKFYVLKATRMPASLVECGFITNPEEAQWIKNHLSEIAQALAQGVQNLGFGFGDSDVGFGHSGKKEKENAKLAL